MPNVSLKQLMEAGGMMLFLEKEKGVHPDDEITIPQIGRMTYKQLAKNIELKVLDLAKTIKRGDFDKISDRQLETFSHFVRVAKAYKEGSKVPLETKFKG